MQLGWIGNLITPAGQPTYTNRDVQNLRAELGNFQSNQQRPTVGGGARLENISRSEALRIQNAANRTKQNIAVVGSRASGKASPISDWDYVMSGNSNQRHSARSSLPRGSQGGEQNSMGRETGIDIFTGKINLLEPHIIFTPREYK